MAESEMYAVNGDLSIPKPRGVSEVYIVNGDTSVAKPKGVSPVYAVNGDTSIPKPRGVSPIYLGNIESEVARPVGVSVVKVGNFSVTPPEPPGPPPLPEKTLRFKFSDPSFDPTSKSGLRSDIWTWAVHDADNGIWDLTVTKTGSSWYQLFFSVFAPGKNNMGSVTAEILDGNLTGVESCAYAFYYCIALTAVTLHDMSAVTITSQMFESCTNLAYVSLTGTSSVTSMGRMFYNCQSLTSVSLSDTSSVTDMPYMFYNCQSLTSLPELSYAAKPNMNYTFKNCNNAETGILDAYNAANSAGVTSHVGTFMDCGSSTTTGSAELAQIPTSWKSWS